MDVSLTRDSIRVNEPLFDGSAEHPVDCEIILPDYCPDIARVLKTEAAVNIDSRTLEGNRFTVDGEFCVRILYLTENESAVRCVTRSEPFSHSFDLKEAKEKTFSKVRARVEFANCRPTGPRKVQVRASVSVTAKVWSAREEDFVSDCEDGKFEMMKKPLKACSMVGNEERPFKVNEEIEIGSGKPPAASIIKTSAAAVVQDCKVISNKIIAKGEALARTLYTCDDGHLETMEYSIPLSQIIDMEGVGEDCSCDVRFLAGEPRVESESNSDGENRILSVEIPVTAEAKAYREKEAFTVSDAFSTEYEMELKTKPVTFENLLDMAKYTEMVRLTADSAGDDVSSVYDCTAVPVITDVKFDGKAMTVGGSMQISVLAANSQGGPFCIEKGLPFSIREELPSASDLMRCEPELTVTSAQCGSMGDGRLDIRVECTLDAPVFGVSQDTVVTDLMVDDTKQKECPVRKTLTLYYADKGERIWDIAKRYNTPMNRIMAENSLESEVLPERAMLLIPKARCRRNQAVPKT